MIIDANFKHIFDDIFGDNQTVKTWKEVYLSPKQTHFDLGNRDLYIEFSDSGEISQVSIFFNKKWIDLKNNNQKHLKSRTFREAKSFVERHVK